MSSSNIFRRLLLNAFRRGATIRKTRPLSRPIEQLEDRVVPALSFAATVGYAAGDASASVAVGDLNGDGSSDLAVGNAFDDTVSVLLGNGDGTFQPQQTFSTGSVPFGVAIADFNGDGSPDLVTADSGVSVLLGNGDGSFQPSVNYPTSGSSLSVAVGDFNGDGRPDIVTDSDDNVSVLLGKGDGTFAAATTYTLTLGDASVEVVVGDFNGDGRVDIATADAGSNSVSVLLGIGDGTFPPATNFAAGMGSKAVAVGDFDGDGNADLVTGNVISNDVSVLLGNGNGTFASAVNYATGVAPDSVAVGDFNGDGRPDITAANVFSNTVSVLLGDGTGSFQSQQVFAVDPGPRGMAVSDLNSDGKPDIVTANELSDSVSVLLNTSISTVTVQSVAIAPSADLATDNDYTRINDAIQAAGFGDTIILQGTFDWREANAAASWALGSDGVADVGYLDDYSIRVPADLAGVTLTAASKGAATIIGPGDVGTIDLEGFLYFDDSGNYQNWTISNLQIYDFDVAVQMWNFGGASDAYSGTTITNNKIVVARDLIADVAENIGVFVGQGTNQTISNNVIQLAGNGVSDSGSFAYAGSVGIETQYTVGTSDMDGLQITGNTIQVVNAQSADPEVAIGVWDNSDAHDSNITISNNTFTNLAAGNNRNLNSQRGFRITSHSGFASTVTYSNNTVSGANIGFQWQPENLEDDLSGNDPVLLLGNTITNTSTGVIVQSSGSASLLQNTITGSGTGINVVNGELEAPGCGCGAAVEENIITGNTTGIMIGTGVSYVGPISNNNINNTTNISTASGLDIEASNNWWGSSVVSSVTAKINAPFMVDYTPFLNTGTDTSATQGFQGNFGNLTVHNEGIDLYFGRVQEGADTVLMGGTLVIASSLGAETFGVGPYVEGGAFIFWAGETAYATGLGTLTINANEGNDIFNVALPSSVDIGTLNLNGGNPITFPGDTLNLDVTGTNAAITPGTDGNAIAAGFASTYWTSIETMPVPTGFGGQYDFQPSITSPVQPGSIAVLPSTTYTAARGYGWTKTPWRTYDVGALPSLAGNPLAFQLRDYMSDFGGLSSAGIFRVDLPSTAPVQITAFLGDASGALDGIEVAYSTNGTTFIPITPGGGLSIPAGKFTNFISGAITPGGSGESGMLWIRFQDIAGSTSNWSASGLAVRPVASVGALSVTSPSKGALSADGMSVDPFTVTGAAPGALLNITATLGTIVTDVRPEVLGNQVIADEFGNAAIQIRRPYLNGTSTVTVTDFTGAATGSTTQVYSLPTVRRFDMNSTTPSLPDATWFDVRNNSLYTPTAGYGWVSAPSAADLGTYPAGSTPAQQGLYRDYHYGTGTNTFKAYVGSSQTVDVKIYTYAPSLGYSGMTVSLEGGAYQAVSGNSTTFRVTVGADGILDINFKASMFFNWVTNGIEITQVPT